MTGIYRSNIKIIQMSNKEKDQFKKRFSVFQIEEAELERMFKQEELRIRAFEVNEAAFQAAMANEVMMQMGYGAGGGGGASQTTATAIQFVVNTTDYLEFNFNFTSTGEPIEFTINWGDGTIHEDSGAGGYYEEGHEYAEVGEYTVTVTFDDPLKILELDFPGDGDYAGISSITNLQYLSNLQDFRADYNHLVSVDLSGLTNLTYVDISDCELPGSSTHSLTSVNLSGCTALGELRLDDSDFSNGIPDLNGLTALRIIDFDECGITGTVDISGFPSLERFDFNSNEGLTRIIISSSQPLGDNGELYAYDCALTQTAVNNILVALAANAIDNGYVDLSGGTNAIPGASGLAAITTLEGKGWSVEFNI
jgi:Leucine-rich repeat (LRR) protein